MFRTLATVAVATLIAGAAVAGNVVYVAPDVVAIEEPMRAGIGNWLIPLAIIAIIALSLTSREEDEGAFEECNPFCGEIPIDIIIPD